MALDVKDVEPGLSGGSLDRGRFCDGKFDSRRRIEEKGASLCRQFSAPHVALNTARPS
jgi:hypothetical protein